MKKGILVSLASSAVLGSLLIGSVAFAQTTTAAPAAGGWQGGARGHMMGRMLGVFGTVSAVNGTSLTITSKAGPNGTPAAATYTVDASSATVTKAAAASSVSAIAVGDTLMVQGTVTGTSVVAKTIRDGIPAMGMKGARPEGQASSTPLIQGNGEPVIGGSVSAVSGNTLTVTTAQGGIAYSVDVTSATVKKGNTTSSISAITVGDKVVVQGSVSGTAVTATSVIDQGAAPAAGGTPSDGQSGAPKGPMGGFFGAIGGLFQHLFGFF